MATKLHVLLALAKGVKTRTHNAKTALHRNSQVVSIYEGRTRRYSPNDDAGEQLPDEDQRVQTDASEVLAELRRLLVERWDMEATVVNSNRNAVADLIVDGVTLASDVPSTVLLYLEDELEDLYTFVAKLPTLDPSVTWTRDENRGTYVGSPQETLKTKKIRRGVVLYEATDKHPAQVDRVDEDVVVGRWTTVRLSGALPVDEKRAYLMRVVKLRDAVKEARQRANEATVVDLKVADSLLSYVLADR